MMRARPRHRACAPTPVLVPALVPVLALGLLLAGCVPAGKWPYFTLIDQGTFRGPTPPPTADDIARSKLPPLPLVTIRFDQPDSDYTQALAAAVESAQAHKADVAFDVLAPVPLSASHDVQAQFTAQGETDTQAVASALAADGINPDHIHIGFRGDPGDPPREVRVYAR